MGILRRPSIIKGMKITRYPQSCLLIEQDNHKIVIDPGVHFLQTHTIDELNGVEAALYTHQHSDHYDPEVAKTLIGQGVVIYANESTAQLIGIEKVNVVKDGDSFAVGGFKVDARELPHSLLLDGSAGPQNTGYIVNDILFHPGDGKELAGLAVDNLALPITGPDISYLDAINFAKQVSAKVVIPIHYAVTPLDAQAVAEYMKKGGIGFEIRVLGDGEPTQL
jgi:L-ascorbate metabolism protein UlaG (beta-lactamase superfamily)